MTRTAPAVAADDFRAVMGEVCSQVAVVTTAGDAVPAHGTTVTAFCSLSLDPPLVSVALDRGSRLLSVVRCTGRVGVNLLAEGQESVATGFARKGDDKFDAVDWRLDDGLPRLAGHAGWLAATVRNVIDGGDHVVLFCLVTAASTTGLRPLVYSRRTFGTHSDLGRSGPLSSAG